MAGIWKPIVVRDAASTGILDSLDSQIAVIDKHGVLHYVNQAWIRFSQDNGMPEGYQWLGVNYLDVCTRSQLDGERDGGETYKGIQSVLAGNIGSFTHEYPCHSPDAQRWFVMRITALMGQPGYFVISHHLTTERKLNEIKLGIENQRLLQLSTTDGLTSVANRLRIEEFLGSEIYRAGRYDSHFSIVMLDIDHFKQVNDQHGHQKGDYVLSVVASLLRGSLRESDLIGRWGGEEFLVVLPECDAEAAALMAEKLRVAVESHHFDQVGGKTCSFGVASYKAGHDAATVVACADAALYRAKANGRNRVEVATPGCQWCTDCADKLGVVAFKASDVCS